MSLTRRYYIRPLYAVIFWLWTPVAAFAAALAVTGSENSPLNVPPVLLFACLVVSTLAGATTLMLQIVSELKANAAAGVPDKALLHPWINAATHMLGSWLASVLAFILCMVQQAGVWWVLGDVLMAAFLGAPFVAAAANKVMLARAPVVTSP